MGQDIDDVAESEWREGFRRRLIQARGPRTQAIMAELLGFSGPHATNKYGKYEGGRKSMMPVRHLPRFCKICGVSLMWLITGKEEAVKAAAPRPKKPKKAAAPKKVG